MPKGGAAFQYPGMMETPMAMNYPSAWIFTSPAMILAPKGLPTYEHLFYATSPQPVVPEAGYLSSYPAMILSVKGLPTQEQLFYVAPVNPLVPDAAWISSYPDTTLPAKGLPAYEQLAYTSSPVPIPPSTASWMFRMPDTASKRVGLDPSEMPSYMGLTLDLASSYTQVIVPTSGYVTATATLTYTLNGILTTSVTITPSATEGSFSPTSVTIAAGSMTGTTTFTDSVVGISTISSVNNEGLTNPANITFNALAPGTGANATSLVLAADPGTYPTYTVNPSRQVGS